MHEPENFTIIYKEIYPDLSRFLESLLGRGGLAQEIAQETFIRLCQKGCGEIPEAEIRFWLFRVGRNLALNELNKGRLFVKFADKLKNVFKVNNHNPEEAVADEETKYLVHRMLLLLPEHQRAVLLLREQQEMSYREIASILEISEAKVKSDIFRARTALRSKWLENQKSATGRSTS